MPRVYLDACCINRPFDDQRQARIRIESEAVIMILSRVLSGDDVWIGSEALIHEIDQIPSGERRRRVRDLMMEAQEQITITENIAQRSRFLTSQGFGTYDALHIACAESAKADVLLTTDDRLVRRAVSQADLLRVRVANPVIWLNEVSAV